MSVVMKKILYVGLGVLAFAGNFFIPHNWGIVAYYPWALLIVLLILDIFKRNFARACFYTMGLGLAYLACIFLLFLGPSASEYTQSVQFDSVTWKRGDNLKNPVRIHMVDDLLKRNSPVGMNKAQLDELLGQPSVTSKFKEYDHVYWLGPEHSLFSIDSEWLGIKFNDGIVTEANIVRD